MKHSIDGMAMQHHSTSISQRNVPASLPKYLRSGSMHRQAAAHVIWHHKQRSLQLLLLLVLAVLGPPGETAAADLSGWSLE